MKPGEKGFTLIELLVVAGIMTVAASAAAGGIYQIIRNTERNSNHMAAVMHVQNAGNRITWDVQTSQSITTMEELTAPDFLLVSWVDADTGDRYEVTYTLEDMETGTMKNLFRTQSINDSSNQTLLISTHINYTGENTTCNYTAGIFNLTVTAAVGSGTAAGAETRLYRIFPRPG